MEILVVAALIGIVGILAAVAVNAARSKQRDATRIANVRQIQSGLEDFFNENNKYPDAQEAPLGDSATSACLGVSGFQGDCAADRSTILRFVPRTFDAGIKGLVSCGDPSRKAFCYSSVENGSSYVIYFELENALPTVGIRKGVNCAVPGKMEACNR